jgi:hypothetical protein
VPGGNSLRFRQQLGLILFEVHDPGQAQRFDGFHEGFLQVQGIGHQQIEERRPSRSIRSSNRVSVKRLALAVLLKANAQGNGQGAEAVVVLPSRSLAICKNDVAPKGSQSQLHWDNLAHNLKEVCGIAAMRGGAYVKSEKPFRTSSHGLPKC